MGSFARARAPGCGIGNKRYRLDAAIVRPGGRFRSCAGHGQPTIASSDGGGPFATITYSNQNGVERSEQLSTPDALAELQGLFEAVWWIWVDWFQSLQRAWEVAIEGSNGTLSSGDLAVLAHRFFDEQKARDTLVDHDSGHPGALLAKYKGVPLFSDTLSIAVDLPTADGNKRILLNLPQAQTFETDPHFEDIVQLDGTLGFTKALAAVRAEFATAESWEQAYYHFEIDVKRTAGVATPPQETVFWGPDRYGIGTLMGERAAGNLEYNIALAAEESLDQVLVAIPNHFPSSLSDLDEAIRCAQFATNPMSSAADRENNEAEYEGLIAEIQREVTNSSFLEQPLLTSSSNIKIVYETPEFENGGTEESSITLIPLTLADLGLDGTDLNTVENAQAALTALQQAKTKLQAARASFENFAAAGKRICMELVAPIWAPDCDFSGH